MKLHLESTQKLLIRSYGAGSILINDLTYSRTVALTHETILEDLCPVDMGALETTHFDQLLEHAPELIILGTGATQRFPSPALLAPLAAARCGIEVMDTGAACRTYNILAAEGRRVAALLFMI